LHSPRPTVIQLNVGLNVDSRQMHSVQTSVCLWTNRPKHKQVTIRSKYIGLQGKLQTRDVISREFFSRYEKFLLGLDENSRPPDDDVTPC